LVDACCGHCGNARRLGDRLMAAPAGQ
jgi:hypothetical protein